MMLNQRLTAPPKPVLAQATHFVAGRQLRWCKQVAIISLMRSEGKADGNSTRREGGGRDSGGRDRTEGSLEKKALRKWALNAERYMGGVPALYPVTSAASLPRIILNQ